MRRFVDEELNLEKEALDKQADAIGSIKVSAERVIRRKLSAPDHRANQYTPDIPTDVAKEIIKDRKISHAIK